jgi:signal transduction histidine kinase
LGEDVMALRVLCIESDSALRAKVRRLLEAEGLTVDETATGLAGIERARTLPPDLVVADVHLPDIDGTELATRLKQEKALAAVPFIAMGRAPDEHDLAIAAGCDGFIALPIDESGFRERVRAFLAGERECLPEDGERRGLKALSASMASRLENAVAGASRAEQLLAERNRLGRVFMHNLAHELSTPLTPLSGYLKILQSEKLGALGPQHKKIVDAMGLAVERLARIVDNLSVFASLSVGQAAILPSTIDPDALAGEVVDVLRPAIREARLHVAVSKAGGGLVVADARKLRQAVSNLVGNAVKFSPHGGEVLVEVQRDRERLRFAVYDQGPGVPGADSENIFEPFFHASGSEAAARVPGSGLGLPVARRIAEAHGGKVWVESPPRTQPGSISRHFTGAKFVLEIPLRPAAQGEQGAPPARVSG